MKSKLGFTGSRTGMTLDQAIVVEDLVVGFGPKWVYHGDCKGSDATFHHIVRLAAPKAGIVAHPGMDSRGNSPTRAFCEADQVMSVLPYLERDRIIVEQSDMVIATPNGHKEIRRSGTWATIRMARRARKPLRIVYPDGTIASENG